MDDARQHESTAPPAADEAMRHPRNGFLLGKGDVPARF